MRKLILGGGGPAGAAWLGGLADGLVEQGVALGAAEEVLGTSAGAVLGAWLAADRPLARFTAAMADRARWHAAQGGPVQPSLLGRMGRSAGLGHPSEEEIRQIAAQAAQVMRPQAVTELAAVWARWLPDAPWPASLRMVCADAATGRPRVWGPPDGLTLAEGIATTTAAPGAAAPVLMHGRMWVDGGVRSSTNADLLAPPRPGGPERVLVLAPLPGPVLELEVESLRRRGADVTVVVPDRQSVIVLSGGSVLDPQTTRRAALAATAQVAATRGLREWWDT
ncbi:patatin-like phospholipase family protein [Actinoallomurus soli]|uniref:patatin-like phospholipase family protein n=1 Tax=Actinoallomurus soli TaxID=2952535 RepID=UPI002091EB7B|nr:patatin-like phospholipase family protein [Actinoallomurus soli]MCO5968051.1 patatin-like phospholipase family protein [Actinoallomurus soli]